MNHILMIEDDQEISNNLRNILKEEGFKTTIIKTPQDLEKISNYNDFDLVLLDLILPGATGYSICTQIKKQATIPIMILTAMQDEYSVVAGFNVGADDYLSKPFRPLELIARIQNLLRRYQKQPSIIQISNIKIDTLKATVTKENQEVVLSALEYKLLLTFINHQGEILTRNRLLEEIWDLAGEFVNDNTLTVYIKRLREKIEDNPNSPNIIKTIRGIGYKLGE